MANLWMNCKSLLQHCLNPDFASAICLEFYSLVHSKSSRQCSRLSIVYQLRRHRDPIYGCNALPLLRMKLLSRKIGRKARSVSITIPGSYSFKRVPFQRTVSSWHVRLHKTVILLIPYCSRLFKITT